MRKKITKRFLAIGLILVVSFLPIWPRFSPKTEAIVDISEWNLDAIADHNNEDFFLSSNPEYITQDTFWAKTQNRIVKKGIVIDGGATLTIEKGTTIRFEKDENDYAPFILVKNGNIVANGTEREKINFTSNETSNFSLVFYDESQKISFFRHVEVSKAGGEYIIERGQDAKPIAQKFFSVAHASSIERHLTFPVYYSSGKVHFENSRFFQNKTSDIFISSVEVTPDDPGKNHLEVVNSNFEENESNTAVISNSYQGCEMWPDYASCEEKIVLKNNWYGHAAGAARIYEDYDYFNENRLEFAYDLLYKGEIVVGFFAEIDGFRSKNLIADPAIVVPGIMGSAEDSNGQWKLDPILHTYDDLYNSFLQNGYESNYNLFSFPYEWRNSNEISAQSLKAKIAEIKNNTKASKVDLVTHSMGGLVSRQYIQSQGYQDDVDQLITLGTPHRGSPKSYLTWEAGEGFFRISDKLGQRHFYVEAMHAGYNNLSKYIRDKVVSVGQLLPDYNYLYDSLQEEMRNYPDGYPDNLFLENLNKPENLTNLESVRFTNIVGDVENDSSTIEKIRVVEANPEIWEHGQPEKFYDESTDQGLEYGQGDETVPKFSAEAISADEIVQLDSTHGDLPTVAQCEVFARLTGKTECDYRDIIDIPNVLMINLFSPIDVQIIAPDGKKIGKNFSAQGEESEDVFDEIEGAYYSGFDTENEFVVIPNPMEGEYRVLTQGTGDGEYKVEAISMKESEDGEIQEKVETFEGTAALGETGEEVFELKFFSAADETAPELTLNSPLDGAEYLNDEILDIDYKVQDDVSKAKNIDVRIYYDGNLYEQESIDLSLETLGEHTLKIVATDESEKSSEIESFFIVTTNAAALRNNVQHYYNLGLFYWQADVRFIRSHLQLLRVSIEQLDEIKSRKRISLRGRMQATAFYRNAIQWRSDVVISYLQKFKGKRMDLETAEKFVEELEALRDSQ